MTWETLFCLRTCSNIYKWYDANNNNIYQKINIVYSITYITLIDLWLVFICLDIYIGRNPAFPCFPMYWYTFQTIGIWLV